MDADEHAERVLRLVEQVPRGRVTTYGALADAVGARGPRAVGRVLSLQGGGVPWWRVVRADGSPPPDHEEARARYLDEGTALRPSGRVDLPVAFWDPAQALLADPDVDPRTASSDLSVPGGEVGP